MRRLLMLAVAGSTLMVLAGCAARMDVSAHRERGIDFSQYRTFAWAPADALPTSDPRLDNNPFFRDYFQGAVERQLALRGIERAAWGTPDLLVHYHVNVRQRFQVAGTDSEYPYCTGAECQGRIVEYEAGTFVLDVVDGYSNTLVWRGWAQTSVDGVVNDQDWLRDHLEEAVVKMLRLFPSGENESD
jgi:hypothetical protein